MCQHYNLSKYSTPQTKGSHCQTTFFFFQKQTRTFFELEQTIRARSQHNPNHNTTINFLHQKQLTLSTTLLYLLCYKIISKKYINITTFIFYILSPININSISNSSCNSSFNSSILCSYLTNKHPLISPNKSKHEKKKQQKLSKRKEKK